MQLRTPLGGFIDLWEVRIGEIQRLLTPADLKDALERGAIHERTPVKRPGTLTWIDASAVIAPGPAAPARALVKTVVRTAPPREGSSARAIFLFGVCIAAAVAIFFQEGRDAALAGLHPAAAPPPVVSSAPAPPASSVAAAPTPPASALVTPIPSEATSAKVDSPRAPKKKKMAGARSADRSTTAQR
jgi:hypothetical protein